MTMIINGSNGTAVPLKIRKALASFDNSKAPYL
jgi:hypothetical protein